MQYPDAAPNRLDPSSPRLTLSELRERMGAIARIDPLPGWTMPRTDLVVPRGSLVEILGHSSREWLIETFASHPRTRIAWIEPSLTLFPPAVEQRGVSLKRWLFIETKNERSWSLLQVMRSKLFHFAVTPSDLIPARAPDAFLRKLQIQAERSGTTLFFLSEEETPLFAIAHRIRIESGADGRPSASVLKRKRG